MGAWREGIEAKHKNVEVLGHGQDDTYSVHKIADI
jgi:hypothetical protein